MGTGLVNIYLKPIVDLCCLDFLEISQGACRILHKYCILEDLTQAWQLFWRVRAT